MAVKCRVTFAAVVVAILVVAMAMGSTPAEATPPLTSWSGPGCSGQAATVEYCGCSDLQFYEGQDLAQDYSATFYTETGCAGTPYNAIGGFRGTQYCGDFGFRSVYIDC